MAYSFSDSFMTSGGWKQPLTTKLRTTKSMTMKYLLDIGIQKEVQNENKIWHNLSVYKFETKIKKNTIFENANFTKLYNIINIEVSI